MVKVAMGWVPAATYYRDQADRKRAAEAELARRTTLHGKAVARRRKRKNGGPK
jgi:hypothetical protein